MIELTEKPEYLQDAYMAPLNPVACPDTAFECNNSCGERLNWNPQTQKLECWNPDCDLYAGDSVEKSGGDK